MWVCAEDETDFNQVTCNSLFWPNATSYMERKRDPGRDSETEEERYIRNKTEYKRVGLVNMSEEE